MGGEDCGGCVECFGNVRGCTYCECGGGGEVCGLYGTR